MLTGILHLNTNETHMPTRVGTKGHENVIPAKAGIQRIRELDSRLHGNDRLEVFSYQTNTESNANDMAPVNGGQAVSATAEASSEGNLNSDNFIAILSAILSGLNNAMTKAGHYNSSGSPILIEKGQIGNAGGFKSLVNENVIPVIPAEAGIQKAKNLDSRLHGNDGLEVFSYHQNIVNALNQVASNFWLSGAAQAVNVEEVMQKIKIHANANINNDANSNANAVSNALDKQLLQVKAMTDSAQRLNQVLSGYDARPEGNWAAQTAANAVAKNENNPPSPPFIKGWMGGFSGENAAELKNNYTGPEQGHQQGHQRNGIEIIKSLMRGSGSADRAVTEGTETLSASKQSSIILNSASGLQTSYSQDAVVKDSMHITKLHDIGNFFIKTLNSGSRHLTINLQPPDLGSIQIKLKMSNGILTANLKVESLAVKELFSSALPQIRASLADSGVKLSDFFVDVKKEDNYYDSMKQHRDGSQHDNQRHKKYQEFKFDYFA